MAHCYSGSTSVPYQAELEDNNQITTAPPLIISSCGGPSASKPYPRCETSTAVKQHHAPLQFNSTPAFLIQPLYSPKNRPQDICALLWKRRPTHTHTISCVTPARNQDFRELDLLLLWARKKIFPPNTRHFSMLGLMGILHQLSSFKQELHCLQQQHYHSPMSQSRRLCVLICLLPLLR